MECTSNISRYYQVTFQTLWNVTHKRNAGKHPFSNHLNKCRFSLLIFNNLIGENGTLLTFHLEVSQMKLLYIHFFSCCLSVSVGDLLLSFVQFLYRAVLPLISFLTGKSFLYLGILTLILPYVLQIFSQK